MPEPTDLVGTVFKILGKELSVRGESGVFACTLRGRLFTEDDSGMRTQVAVGDLVGITPISPTRGVIHTVLDRKTAIIRRVGRGKTKYQVVAANVDQIVIVSALRRPELKTGLIDRFLVIAHDAGIRPSLCLNKIELDEAGSLDQARAVLSTYEKLGYPLILTSAKRGDGIDQLREHLRHKRSVLTGHSGVGKSKLAAAMAPGHDFSSGAVDRQGKGRHTTTASTLVELEGGGELVDTPGVRELSLGHIETRALATGFVELRPYLGQCRFASCSHIPEPDCAVKAAVETGAVSPERYDSYRRLFAELT